MSRLRSVFAALAVACCLIWLLARPQNAESQNAGPADSSWADVDQAIADGLPKTAIKRLEPIIESAVQTERYAEAVKGIGMKVALEGNIQGNRPEEKIQRMQHEIESAPEEMKPVLHAILANWYWHYFQQNRWRLMQRSQTSAPPSDDLQTWDLTRILDEIDQQFQRTLSEAETLQAIPVSQYDALLEKGSAPASYRPTLYDVLAHNALEFYAAGEQVGSGAQDAFDLRADSPIFASAQGFLGWMPGTNDEDSLKLRAVNIYQSLLRFHQQDQDQSAFLDTDLLRLNFGNSHAFGEEKSARYKAALRRFADQHASHVISTRALHHLASVVHEEGDFVQARTIARVGVQRFQDSVGGRRCFNLIQQIEARSSQVTTERVWNDPRPTIDVHYRNVTKIYFRLVPFEFERQIRDNRMQAGQLNRDQQRQLLSQPPVKSWSVDLPETEDYQQRVERIPSPDGIPAGAYFLIASHNAQFSGNDNQVSFSEVWESDLAIVTRNHQGDGLIDGFVLDANRGDPIRGATVKVWRRDNQGRWSQLPDETTDRNGLFRISARAQRQLMLLVKHRNQSLSSINYLQPYVNRSSTSFQQTRFFTDRALYRPGQTIHYKGICISANQANSDYVTIANRKLTVVFNDVNGKEIERLEHRTNAYGSFSGSVTAPRDRLMGKMTLQVLSGPSGSTQIAVEEYKRPKFRVELDPPTSTAKLNSEVALQGKASAYTGAAVDGAKVSWRVVRQVRYPIWWYWRCWWLPPQGDVSQEIAHGQSVTDADGTFEIDFVAKPDDSVSREAEPTFEYTIYADVTDTTGETRSSQQTIRVGYTSLSATMSTDQWLTDNEPAVITIRTETLDGAGQAASGSVKMYRVVQPQQVQRGPLTGRIYSHDGNDPPESDPTDPNSWPLGDVVYETTFETNESGSTEVSHRLAAGIYRAKLETQDRFGEAVTAVLPLQVLDPESNHLDWKLPNVYISPRQSLEPGEEYTAIWGSGYETARAYIEVEHAGRTLKSYWTKPGTTQATIQQAVEQEMRGGFTVRTTMVRENRAYLESHHVDVPWSNKQLSLQWEHFVSKLEPASREKWTAVIRGPDAERAAAEMVATLYDASLDAYQDHSWIDRFDVFRQDRSIVRSMFENQPANLRYIFHAWRTAQRDGSLTYPHLPPQIVQNFYGYDSMRSMQRMRGRGGAVAGEMGMPMAMADGMVMESAMAPQAKGAALSAEGSDSSDQPADNIGQDQSDAVDLSNVSARKNLQETAFFFPHLVAEKDGTVKLEFTMPEALTEWKFLGFAHDSKLRGGLLRGTTVTSKELMVQPNAPRFLREGDVIEFTVKVSNQSASQQSGTVRLSFQDARTGDSVDTRIENDDRDQQFRIAAGQSKSFSWRLSVPDGLGLLTYKAVGSTGRLSDGEEGFLPVLSRRILVTESMTLPIRGKQTKAFELPKLLNSGGSDSLKHQSLTLQMVSNPSWYAVMALPYLMEYPHECAEQTFNRLYANSLASHIAESDPKIHRVFQQWRSTPALDSPLAKNQDMKSILIEETPWYRQAMSESQARRNVGILFDDNRLRDETSRALHALSQMQLPDGAWPWFSGGRGNDYMTLYITTGFGRLRHLGVQVDMDPAIKSLDRLDGWVTEMYRRMDDSSRDRNHLSSTIAFYLYGRSFFLDDQPIAPQHSEAVKYWLQQASTHWLALSHRQSQAHMAVALKRFGDQQAATKIMRSIEERSVRNEEMGMFWRDLEKSWWWFRAPIETQAMMIEAFDEVLDDQQSVEACKVWLLKQKQTQDWKTTKATADAVYALLLRGSNVLASDQLVEASLGGDVVRPDDVEAGTGFYEQRFDAQAIRPELGSVIVKKVDEGVAWGSLHWQYLEDIGKITPHAATPLNLTKQLYVKRNTTKGPVLDQVDGPIEVGDELVVRLVLRTDRDMEYVHLKDHRGSGTEPVNVLSQYKYQDGLAYYESTRDTASHFFIDYLPKGTYVFEYSTRVQLSGSYQTGIANIQCMYAPEFNSHSQSLPIEVK